MATINKKYGEQYIATASPSTGYRFVKWQGTGVDTTDNPATLTCLGDNTIEALFERLQYTVSVGASPANSGSIVFDPPVINRTINYTATQDLMAAEPTTWMTNNVVSSTYNSNTQEGTLTLNENVNSIGDYAFIDQRFLLTIEIPNCISSMGMDCFSNCWHLTTVSFPATLTGELYSMFYDCSELSTIIGLENTTITNLNGTFKDCTALTSISLPSTLNGFMLSAFEGCTSLTSVIGLENTSTRQLTSTFKGCTSLTSISYPNTTTQLLQSSYVNCSSLTSIICYATTVPYLGTAASGVPNAYLYVPAEALNDYRNNSTWYNAFHGMIFAIQ